MKQQSNSYVSPGSLPKPGWLGRGLRIVLGLLVMVFVFNLGISFHPLVYDQEFPVSIVLWLFALLIFVTMRDVINLGLSVNWGLKAQILTILLALVCIAIDYFLYRRIWAPPLGIFFFIWCLLISIPLGVALILAGLSGLPGCEMRVYAAHWARLRGRSASEHYCPGGIDFIDRWKLR